MELSENNINLSVVKKLRAWKDSPLQFITECLQVTPTEQQLELIAVAGKSKRMTVRSGHGPGKTTVAAWLALWFETTRPYAKTVITAPTNRQLFDQMRAELSKWLRQSTIAEEFVIRKDIIFHKEAPKEWWIRFISPSVRATKEDQAETLAGLHNDHLFIICDESCHDDQTEVLTEDGFKLFADVQDGERVLTMNPATMEVSYVYPKAKIVHDYEGDLYIYKADNLNFAVTPNHRMFYSTQKSNTLRFRSIKDIGKIRISTPKGFKWQGQHLDTFLPYELYKAGWEPFNITDWLVFLGLVISEGNFLKYPDGSAFGINICQSKEWVRELLFRVLSNLKLNFKVYGNDIRIHSVTLSQYLIKECGDGFANKRVPALVKQLTPELINIFLSGFCAGDGWFKPQKEGYKRVFYTSSDKLVDDLQELIFKVGHNATICNRKLKGQFKWLPGREFRSCGHSAESTKDGYMIGESSTETPFSIRMENVKHQPYKGKVYCLSVPPTCLLFTRRSGTCMWSGNSGIPDPTFIPLEGALTSPDNKVLLIGNMTRNSGYFYDTHFNDNIRKDWVRFHWDSRKSSRVDKSMPEYFANKYGIDSNVYRIRVMGEPPLQDDNTLIPLWTAEQCIGQEFEVAEDEPLYLGVDVARYGDDASIILPRRGLKIYPWETFRKLNTIDLGGFVNQTYQELEASGCAIDVIGVGAGVADWLEKHHLKNLYQVNVATSSSALDKYDRLRDELWVRVRDNCLLGKYSFPDVKVNGEEQTLGQQLANELSCVRYKFNKHGGYIIESKKDLKTRGIASPNIADALCLTEYFSNSATRVFAKQKDLNPFARLENRSISTTSWMGM